MSRWSAAGGGPQKRHCVLITRNEALTQWQTATTSAIACYRAASGNLRHWVGAWQSSWVTAEWTWFDWTYLLHCEGILRWWEPGYHVCAVVTSLGEQAFLFYVLKHFALLMHCRHIACAPQERWLLFYALRSSTFRGRIIVQFHLPWPAVPRPNKRTFIKYFDYVQFISRDKITRKRTTKRKDLYFGINNAKMYDYWIPWMRLPV